MNDKKKRDTIAVIKSQLNMVKERLQDKHYSPVWHELKIQEEKLERVVKEFEQ